MIYLNFTFNLYKLILIYEQVHLVIFIYYEYL